MDDLLSVQEAAERLGTSFHVLVALHRRGVLDLHKRVGTRTNLVRLEDAQRALQLRRRRGRPSHAAPPPPSP